MMGGWARWSPARSRSRRESRVSRQEDVAGQSGQALVLFALVLTVLVLGTGLVVDVGYSYQQRRLAQNAADAASLAAAQYLAAHMNQSIPDSTMVSLMNSYAGANLPGASISGWYVDGDGDQVAQIGSGYTIPPVSPGSPPTVAGVQLSTARAHNTFFMRLVNVTTVTVKAKAGATYGADQQLSQQEAGTEVLPIVMDQSSYNTSVNCNGYGQQITFSITNSLTAPYDCVQHLAGFNWGPLVVTSNSNSVINDLLTPNGPYANVAIGIGSNIEVAPGERANDYGTLDSYWAGKDVMVPLVSHDAAVSAGCPQHCWVPLVQVAWFHVVSANGHGATKTIVGYWVNPASEAPIAGGGVPSTSTAITGPVTFGLTR